MHKQSLTQKQEGLATHTGVCIVSSDSGTTSIVEALVTVVNQQLNNDDEIRRRSDDEFVDDDAIVTSPRAKTAIQESLATMMMSEEEEKAAVAEKKWNNNNNPLEGNEEEPLPAVVTQEEEEEEKEGDDDDTLSSSTTTSSVLSEQGQEALWVEEEEEKSTMASPRRFSLKKKLASASPKKRSKKKQQQRHVMLLGEEEHEPPLPPIDTTAVAVAAADDDEKEKQLQAAAGMILAARKLLDQSAAAAAACSRGGDGRTTLGNAETLKKAAFCQAVEARKLLLLSSSSSSSEKIMTPEHETVLQDAMTKGVTTDNYEISQQLLEFILPVVDESYLKQAASSTRAPLVLTAALSQDDITADISSLGFNNTFDEYCYKSPRANNKNDFDVLSMSSLNEILDGPVTPPAIPKEVNANTTTKAKPTSTTEKTAAEPTTATTTEKAQVAAAVGANTTTTALATTATAHKKGLFGRFGKNKKMTTEKKQAKNKKSSSSIEQKDEIQRFSAKVIVEEDEQTEAAVPEASLRAASIDARVQNLLQGAIDQDDTMSLTSLEGVPVHEKVTDQAPKKKKKTSKKKKKKQADVTNHYDEEEDVAGKSKPVNFDAVKPKFVAAPRGNTSILWDSVENDKAAADPPAAKDDSNKIASTMYSEPLPSQSPVSSVHGGDCGGGTIPKDKYQIDESTAPTDKYAVLPDPCTFCSSFWMSAKDAPKEKAAEEMPEDSSSPMMVKDLVVDGNDNAPPMDKYAQLEDLANAFAAAENDASSKEEKSSEDKVKDATQKGKSPARLVAGLFGKLKKNGPKNLIDKVPAKQQESSRKLKASPMVKKSKKSPAKKKSKKETVPAAKSILKEKKEASQNIEQAQSVMDQKQVAEPLKTKITVESSVSSSNKVIAEPQDPALPSLVEDSSQSSDGDNDHLVEHIKQQQHRQRRGKDPATAEEVVVASRGIDP